MSKNLIAKIDKIIEKENTWIIDYLPERVEDWNKFKWLEAYMLKKKQKEKYANQITNTILKIISYFNATFYIENIYKKCFKKYEGCFKAEALQSQKLVIILQKLIVNDETVLVYFKQNEFVIALNLYDTTLYLSENQDISLIKSIVESEGLFLRKE